MAPIKPTSLPPTPAVRPDAGTQRTNAPFPAPSKAPSGPVGEADFQKLEVPSRLVAAPIETAASSNAAAGGTAGTAEARQIFTLQTLSTYAGLVVGQADAAEAAAPATGAAVRPRAVAQRPLPPGSQIDIKV